MCQIEEQMTFWSGAKPTCDTDGSENQVFILTDKQTYFIINDIESSDGNNSYTLFDKLKDNLILFFICIFF